MYWCEILLKLSHRRRSSSIIKKIKKEKEAKKYRYKLTYDAHIQINQVKLFSLSFQPKISFGLF